MIKGGDALRTKSEHWVHIDHVEKLRGVTHPVCGWVYEQYPNVRWSKMVWTIEGNALITGHSSPLDLIIGE